MAEEKIALLLPKDALADYFASCVSDWAGWIKRAKKSLLTYGTDSAEAQVLADYFQNDLEGWARGYAAWRTSATSLLS
jgi:hypothetical protein